MTGFNTTRFQGRSYVQCNRCKGWGRKNWTHMCKRPGLPFGNWYRTPADLERARARQIRQFGE